MRTFFVNFFVQNNSQKVKGRLPRSPSKLPTRRLPPTPAPTHHIFSLVLRCDCELVYFQH